MELLLTAVMDNVDLIVTGQFQLVLIEYNLKSGDRVLLLLGDLVAHLAPMVQLVHTCLKLFVSLQVIHFVSYQDVLFAVMQKAVKVVIQLVI